MVIFAVVELVPGDPASYMLGTGAQPDTVAALREQLGLDRPWPLRYLGWIGGVLTGDLGHSFTYKTPVGGMILDRMQVSLPLALMALVIAVLIAFPIGIYAAAHRGRPGDTLAMGMTQIGISLPNFWFAMLLVLVFAVNLQLLPAGGFPGWNHPLAALRALILPAIALALVQAAILARVTRSAVLDVMREDFVRTARAKGLNRRQALWRHVLRNAMIPVLTVSGLQFANLITGTIVVENVFVLPGIGRLVFQAISNRDLLVVRDVVMLLAAVVVIVNFVVDVLYAVVDPRLRHA